MQTIDLLFINKQHCGSLKKKKPRSSKIALEMITKRKKKDKTSVGQSKLLNYNMLSLLWANETSALLGNGSVLAVSVTHLLVLAALAKKMASNIHANHPPMYFICLK